LTDLAEHQLAARIGLPLQRNEFEELYIKGAFQQEPSGGNDQLYRKYPKVETQMCFSVNKGQIHPASTSLSQ
tara:strand:- start:26 stop:241 length:216 start_codon:yes stop_codon:yes gene_type:complete